MSWEHFFFLQAKRETLNFDINNHINYILNKDNVSIKYLFELGTILVMVNRNKQDANCGVSYEDILYAHHPLHPLPKEFLRCNTLPLLPPLPLRESTHYLLIMAHFNAVIFPVKTVLRKSHPPYTKRVIFLYSHASCALQLTAAPKVLPPSLVSADFAANQLTRIYPYTFGHKPKLR